MIGSSLTRFASDRRFLIYDTESESLNLGAARPWELSYAIASLKHGIELQRTWVIRYDNPPLRMNEESARISHFDQARYDQEARPAAEVWADFGPLLYSPDPYPVGHNLLGFDVYMVSSLRRAVGLEPDHSWTERVYDTDCLSKAYFNGFVPDLSAMPLSFLSFQFKCQSHREKGLKSRLGVMCETFGIEYDLARAHGAGYDVERNWLVFKELVMRVEC